MKETSNTGRLSATLLVSFLLLVIALFGVLESTVSLNYSAFTSTFETDDSSIDVIKDVLLHPQRITRLRPNQVDEETLWLARAIFSETKRPGEQVLVAWVIRNRVETGYRKKNTYETVVLDPYQFSAFRRGTALRSFYSSLNALSDMPGWQTALRIAYDIRHMDKEYRPFSELTRHFYSQRSMKTALSPAWANGKIPVEFKNGFKTVDEDRFRFFEGIS
ncbi:MAG: hypothetical protein E2O84_01870 [Bacteroidetes bacterium]|nr:MAG: hypothetical protein E2O84_01870 [Bacteroidota bacterium]